jgi:hypothetical protein
MLSMSDYVKEYVELRVRRDRLFALYEVYRYTHRLLDQGVSDIHAIKFIAANEKVCK